MDLAASFVADEQPLEAATELTTPQLAAKIATAAPRLRAVRLEALLERSRRRLH